MQRTYIHSILPLGVSPSCLSPSATPRNLFDTNAELPSPDMPMPSSYVYLLQELLVFSRLSGSEPAHTADRKKLWDMLLAPFDRAVLSSPPPNVTYPERLIYIARGHLREHPCEIGGPNRGPWVRFYMRGHDGSSFPWCAGFVSALLAQAAGAGRPPIPHCYSCDALARQARYLGTFLTASDIATVRPAWIFLCRKTSGGWGHTGFVENVDGDSFVSIEGNASAGGGTEGVEVCRRVRRIAGKDFIATWQ